jgi:hypothetical protein
MAILYFSEIQTNLCDDTNIDISNEDNQNKTVEYHSIINNDAAFFSLIFFITYLEIII